MYREGTEQYTGPYLILNTRKKIRIHVRELRKFRSFNITQLQPTSISRQITYGNHFEAMEIDPIRILYMRTIKDSDTREVVLMKQNMRI